MYRDPSKRRGRRLAAASLFFTLVFQAESETQWWKGNLHTHSLWSDGNDYPEMIAQWYRDAGYDFLSFTEHNTLQKGDRWITPEKRGGLDALEEYRNAFGSGWVETRENDDGELQVRLKTLDEYQAHFNAPNEFLLVQGEEITSRYLTSPVHINAINLAQLIPAPNGDNVLDVMTKAVNATMKQRETLNRPMFPHINHPNFGWGITAEELMRVPAGAFFEVYNGHPSVRNDGDEVHASTERMWDIILTWRLAKLGLPPIYGIATDDSHHYHERAPDRSNTGRGWVHVKSQFLTPAHIVLAMERGDFYASSGVTLEDFSFDNNRYHVAVQPENDATYTIRFIGTRSGFDDTNDRVRTTGGSALRITHQYSEDVGEVLLEVEGVEATYELKGDEIYLRAEVISSAPMRYPTNESSPNKAWTPPFAP